MAAGSAGPPVKGIIRSRVPTKLLVLAIVKLYQQEDPVSKKIAGDLAGCIIESYTNTDTMKRDIISAYVSDRNMFIAMTMQMKKLHYDEAKILSEIFGMVLFGEIL